MVEQTSKEYMRAGDASVIAPAQIIIAAAEGVRAAAGVNMDLTQKEFLE